MAESSTVARPYARAIFELARDAKCLGAWSVALATVADVVRDSLARSFLSRRDLDDAARVSFRQAVCTDAGETEVLATERGENLLRLLAENHRLSALPEIAVQFDALKARAENTIKVQLVTATGVGEPVVSKIKDALEQKLGRTVELELQEDPGLIGGAVIHAEGRVIDGSVKSRLSELADKLIA